MAIRDGKLPGATGVETTPPPDPPPWKGVSLAAVAHPRNAEEVAAVLRVAAEEGLGVVPGGRGTRLTWGNRPSKGDIIILSLDRMDGVVAHEPADMTVTVQPGLGLSNLQKTVLSEGNRIDVGPVALEEGTVGGFLASGSTGPVHCSPSDLILGMQVVFGDGSIVRTGGRVVKNVAGYDLHKTLVGSFGTLGVITEVTLRLYPAPASLGSLCVGMLEADAAGALEELRASRTPPRWTLIDNQPWPRGPRRQSARKELRGLLLFEGEEEAVKSHIGLAGKVFDSGSRWAGLVVIGERFSSEGLQASLDGFQGDRPVGLTCRIGLSPSRLLEFFDAVGDVPLVGHVESGLLRATLPGDGGPGSKGPGEEVSRLRDIASRMEGYLVVEGPAPEGIDVWGPPPPGFFLMEALKREFDPKSVLSPGRFIGGL